MTLGIEEIEFRRQEEALRQILLSKFMQAMREDLSEWISSLSFQITVTPDHFLENLENGIILCQQARLIQRYAEEYVVLNPEKKLKIPSKEVYYTEKGAYPRSFVARDNVANFIQWCRDLGIPDVVIFESEDLVLHKNEKSVILTLLDVARKAYTFGVQPPEIVRFEKEIDEEIEKDKEDEKMGRPPPKPRDLEEDNNLDTMVRNIVKKCTCYDRFPIKKLAEGKYKLGRNDTLIFVRIMRKHVMVRVGGGWDTLDNYITKHDPCRTKIAGNIENNGHTTAPVNNVKVPANRKKSLGKVEPIKSQELHSTNSSDTWSMCSGSSEGSGSLESSRNDCRCGDKQVHKRFNRKDSFMSTSSTATSSGNSDVAISFTKSIEEIDERLKLLDDNKPALDLTMKDTNVYDNKGDRWLRSHMNTIKQRRMTIGNVGTISNPMDEFTMRRGYTADVIERTNKENAEPTSTGSLLTPKRHTSEKSRSKTSPNIISSSLDQGLNYNSNYCSLPRTRRKSKGDLPAVRRSVQSPDMLSASNHSLYSISSEPTRRSCSDISTQTISTQTDFSVTHSSYSDLPRSLKKKMETPIGQSRIPRPKLQRSNTTGADSRLRKRNFNANSANDTPRMTGSMGLRREKSDLSGGMSLRREKSDLTGRRVKQRQSITIPKTVRKLDFQNRNEKPVKKRNGAVLDVK